MFNIILGIAQGLCYLHGKNMLHRDLKPGNVLLDKDFILKIADFDLMRICDSRNTHQTTKTVAGTA